LIGTLFFSIIFGQNQLYNILKEYVEILLNGAGLALGELRMLGETTEKMKPIGGLVEAVKM
jgi:hypothetical protein